MDPERWNRLCALVERALALPATERETLLAATAANDTMLAGEARRMLRSATSTDDFLTPPSSARSAADGAAGRGVGTPVPAPGGRIAGYRLLSVLAAGGMGTVFVAEQESPRRRVALKVLHAGVLSAVHRRRFDVESRILAHLKHPGIAQVYDAGVHEEGGLPLPWFALELIEDARSITEHARETALSPPARVALFALVCDAVHHGHLKGVVHRDLKPANLLVDRAGTPHVIDFGVARTTDEDLRAGSLRTEPGQILGTLPYMSPEQLAGDPAAIDARSDVYSLGVVLFELLAGELPYDLGGHSLGEITRAVQERPPRRLAALRPELRGDLETVVLKALDKLPGRRYDSAAALAEDLRRWLDSRPVEARPPSTAHQVALFARRHRALVAAGASVIVVLVAGALLSLRWALRAQEAESRAAGLFGTLFDRSLESTFDFALRAGSLAGGTALSREMLDSALGDLAALREQGGEDPRVGVQLGLARLRLGDVLGNPSRPSLGDADGARAQYESALAEGLVLRGAQPDATPDALEAARLVALARRRLGELEFYAGRNDEALVHLRASLADYEDAAALHPRSAVLGLDLAFAHDKLATGEGRARDFAGAEAHALLAIEGLRAAAADGALPADEAAFHEAGVRLNLAGLHYLAGRHDDALAGYRAIAAVLAPLVAAAPEDVLVRDRLGWANMWIGTTLQALGRHEEAVPALAASLADYRELSGRDTDNINPPLRIAQIRFALAQIARDAGRLGEARDGFRQALADLQALETAGRLPGAFATLPARVRDELAGLPGGP